MFLTDVGTTLGRVHFWQPERPRGDRPLVLVISGAFASWGHLHWLADDQADYVFTHLPGFHSPKLAETSINAFAKAVGEATGRLFPGRPYVALGASTGALVALSLPASRIVAIEPFFQTAPLWAFHEFLAARDAEWIKPVFRDQDYRPILARLRVPARVVVGDVPLEPPRPMAGFPSFVSEGDRALLAAHPLVTLSVVSGGHQIEPSAIRSALNAALVAHEVDEQASCAAGLSRSGAAPAASARTRHGR